MALQLVTKTLGLFALEQEQGELVSLEADVTNMPYRKKSKRLVPSGSLETNIRSREFPEVGFWCSRIFYLPREISSMSGFGTYINQVSES